MFQVYVLFSRKFNKIYIGQTSDLEQRLRSHNELGKKGWTVRFRPWILVHSENFRTIQEALCREKELKTGRGREWVWKLVRSSDSYPPSAD